MTKSQQPVPQVLSRETLLYVVRVTSIVFAAGGRGPRHEAARHGREAHAQPLPQEHVRPDRGDQEPQPLPQPVSGPHYQQLLLHKLFVIFLLRPLVRYL